MGLVRLALKNPHLVVVVALLFLVAGVVSLTAIPVDILPAFKSPGMIIMTFYSGMPANAIDKTITSRMERWCSQATGVIKVESKSVTGISIVKLFFRDDVDPAAALAEVNSLALNTLRTLPPGTLPPIVRPFDPTATLPLCILSVSSPDGRHDEAELQDIARVDLRNQLGGLPGVVAPTAFGGRERAVMVYVRPKDMEARQISPLDVVRSLHNYNAMLAAGTSKFGDEEVQLDSNALLYNVADFNQVPIKIDEDRQVYLRDVGEARDASRIQTALVRIDGRPQVYVPVYRQQGASSLSVVDSVRGALPLMQQRTSEGVKLDVVMDQSVYVRHAISSLVHEGVLGALLAAGMILIFLGDFRSTLIAVLTIPLSVLASIAAMLATGNTVNAMTLGGLALAIGPLVDNAIVVLENTHRHLTQGKGREDAAAVGAGEVSQPAIVATFATIIVLVPLALMPGMGKFLFRPLALTVAFAMLASLLLALTFVPSRCAAWLKAHAGHTGDDPHPTGWGRLHHRIELFLMGLTRRYEGLLEGALRRRAVLLAGVGLLFAASLCLFPFIGQDFFPQVDSGQLTVYVRCPTGTKIEKTNERLDTFEKFIRAVIPAEDIRMVVTEVGIANNWSAAYTANSGPQDAVVKVQLTEGRARTSQEYAALLRQDFVRRQQTDPAFADLRVSFDTGGIVSSALNYGATSPLEIQLSGGSTQAAYAKAREIRDRALTVPGAADVRILQRLDYPQMLIEIDRKKANQLGLDVYQVFQAVTTALNSSVTVDRNFWIDPKTSNQYWIGVQYHEKLETTLEEVRNIPLTSPRTKEVVKVGTVVEFRRPESGPAELTHADLANVITVQVNVDGRDLGGVASDIRRLTKDIELPKGMVLKMSGEYEQMNQSFGNLGFGLAMASVLVYLLMVPLFRSYLSPLIVMGAVPLGLIGVLVTLFATGTTLNVQSLMGIIFMVGIVVANSTMLVDFANKQRALGAPVHKAAVTAAAVRFRPILMTFLATFLALLPMAIGMGKGSEANVPLARAVVGGLVASTALTLFVVPVLYTLLNRDRPEENGTEGPAFDAGGEPATA